jgi:hypothetical protein
VIIVSKAPQSRRQEGTSGSAVVRDAQVLALTSHQSPKPASKNPLQSVMEVAIRSNSQVAKSSFVFPFFYGFCFTF